MASINTYRRNWLKAHANYEREALKVLFNVFRQWGAAIQWDNVTATNYPSVIELNVDYNLMFDAYLQIYTGVGLFHGARIGNDINTQLKDFSLETFETSFSRDVLGWIKANLTKDILTVRRTYIEFVKQIIGQGLDNGESIKEITAQLQKAVQQRNFYRWQAQRIARTETARASNYAASVASSITGFVMQKVWISIIDARTRRPPKSEYNHAIMNGVRVGENEPFNVQGDLLRFPVDPKGEPQNTINCRCGMAVVAARDNNGDLIAI